MSIIPTNGIAKFAKKIGIDNFKIYFIEGFCIVIGFYRILDTALDVFGINQIVE